MIIAQDTDQHIKGRCRSMCPFTTCTSTSNTTATITTFTPRHNYYNSDASSNGHMSWWLATIQGESPVERTQLSAMDH